MVQEKKERAVSEIAKLISDSSVLVFTDYRSIPCSQMDSIRRSLDREARYQVVKNSLTRIAAHKLGIEEMAQFLEGPTAIAFGWGDPVVIAKTLTSSPALSIKGGRLGKAVLARQDVLDLANIPPQKELEAKLLGNLLAPLSSLQGVLAGILRSLINVLEARIKTEG